MPIITETFAFLLIGLSTLLFIIGFWFKFRNLIFINSFFLFCFAGLTFINPIQYVNGSNQTTIINYYNYTENATFWDFNPPGTLHDITQTELHILQPANQTITNINNYSTYDLKTNILFIIFLIIYALIMLDYGANRMKIVKVED